LPLALCWPRQHTVFAELNLFGPRRIAVEGHKAEARFLALKKRDPNTVSEQELLRTAIDCDTVARELRREGGEANLANALSWDQNSRILRGGKETWVNMWAIYRARDVTSEAAARYNAFLKKDARTVSEEELLRTATDCDTVAQNQRWERWRAEPGVGRDMGSGRPQLACREGGVCEANRCAGC
jgi:hypothetical protein